MRKVNRYIIYQEKNRVHGNVAAEYVALAYNEEHVRDMAEEQGVDLEDHIIECVRTDVRNELRQPYKPFLRAE